MYVEFEAADFGHLWVFATSCILELYIGGADFRNPPEVHVNISVDFQMAARGLADSRRYVFFCLVRVQSGYEDRQCDHSNAAYGTHPDQNAPASRGHIAPVSEGLRKTRTKKAVDNARMQTSERAAIPTSQCDRQRVR